jgi:hypothetical protein
MTKANPWRGEVEVILNNESYVLRPTFDALCRIERELDTGLIEIAKRMANGKLALQELSKILLCCNAAAEGEPALSAEIIQAAIPGDGLTSIIGAVSRMLTHVLQGTRGEEE